MYRNVNLFLLSIFLVLTSYGQVTTVDYLFKIYEGQYDEVGVRSGYVNAKGDTVIPMGKFYYCYTDTLKEYAIVITKDKRLVSIDRNEKELFEIMWCDNGPDYVKEGLFRIVKNGKIGYASTKGIIIVKPKYKCASPFENGRAKVALQCKCIQVNEEHQIWDSNEWFEIDTIGKRIE